MLMEATITLLGVMFMLWAAAVWASYREDPNERRPISGEKEFLGKDRYKKGA